MNLTEVSVSHAGEVQIRRNEVHTEAGGTSGSVAVTLQKLVQSGKILGGFQSVEIVGALPQAQAGRAKCIKALAIAKSNASPVIALQQHEWAIEEVTLDRQEISKSVPDFSGETHWERTCCVFPRN